MAQYDETLDLPVAFPPVKLKNVLGEVLSKHTISGGATLNPFRVIDALKFAIFSEAFKLQ